MVRRAVMGAMALSLGALMSCAVDYGVDVAVPDGSFSQVGGDDLFIAHADGDLYVHPGALTATPGTPQQIVDFGAGPLVNEVETVVGVVDDSVVYTVCCEPVSGNVWAAASPSGDPVVLLPGWAAALDPAGDLMAVLSPFSLVVVVLDDDVGVGTQFDKHVNADTADHGYFNAEDVIAAGADTFVVLGWDDRGFTLTPYPVATLLPGEATAIGVQPDRANFEQVARFAGRGPSGELAIAVETAQQVEIRFFDPLTLAELPVLQRNLPASTTSVRLASDGLGLLWIDGGNVYELPAGRTTADLVSQDATAAWYVTRP